MSLALINAHVTSTFASNGSGLIQLLLRPTLGLLLRPLITGVAIEGSSGLLLLHRVSRRVRFWEQGCYFVWIHLAGINKISVPFLIRLTLSFKADENTCVGNVAATRVSIAGWQAATIALRLIQTHAQGNFKASEVSTW